MFAIDLGDRPFILLNYAIHTHSSGNNNTIYIATTTTTTRQVSTHTNYYTRCSPTSRERRKRERTASYVLYTPLPRSLVSPDSTTHTIHLSTPANTQTILVLCTCVSTGSPLLTAFLLQHCHFHKQIAICPDRT